MDFSRDSEFPADLSPLAWVQEELRRSLETVHKTLRRLLRDGDSRLSALGGLGGGETSPSQPLQQAAAQLHQVAGVLSLVGLPAGATVLRAAEAAVERFAQNPNEVELAAVETIERADFALLSFVAKLLAGNKASTLALFPAYRDLQNLNSAERIHPADLWQFEWRWRDLPADPSSQEMAAEAVRAPFEAGLLKYMREASPANAASLSELCASLAASLRQPRSRTLWQLAAALFEAQSQDLLPIDAYVKRLASRLLSQLRVVAQGDQAVSERLAQDLLFFCAQARLPSGGQKAPRLLAVREAFALTEEAVGDYEDNTLGRIDPNWVVQARRRVGVAKESWSSAAEGESHRLAGLDEQFAGLAESLERLFPSGEVLGRTLQRAVVATLRSNKAPPPALAMEVATSILYVEAALDDAAFDQPEQAARVRHLAQRVESVAHGEPPQPLESWMEDLYRRVSDRQTLGSVVHELRASLSEVERQADEYFRNPTQRELLMPVPAQLQAMRGVLSVLGLDQAALACIKMRDEVDELANTEVDASLPGPRSMFERLANNLGALGFLIDMLSVQPALAKRMFRFDAATGRLDAVMGRSAEATKAVPLPEVSDEDERAGPPSLLDQVQAAVDDLAAGQQSTAEIAQNLASLALQAGADDQPALAEAAASAQALLEQLPAESALPTEAEPAIDAGRALAAQSLHEFLAAQPAPAPAPIPEPAAPPPSAPPPAAAVAVDPEMQEIFLEEAGEVLVTAREALAALREDNNDLEQLTTLRRAFHTLKGSSRMVGYDAFGEGGWACEQLLNARLGEANPQADEALLSFTADALAYLANWVEQIAGRASGTSLPDPLRRSADALRLQGQVLPIDWSAAEAPAASVEPASVEQVAATEPMPLETPVEPAVEVVADALIEPLVLTLDEAPLADLAAVTEAPTLIEAIEMPALTDVVEVAELAAPVAEVEMVSLTEEVPAEHLRTQVFDRSEVEPAVEPVAETIDIGLDLSLDEPAAADAGSAVAAAPAEDQPFTLDLSTEAVGTIEVAEVAAVELPEFELHFDLGTTAPAAEAPADIPTLVEMPVLHDTIGEVPELSEVIEPATLVDEVAEPLEAMEAIEAIEAIDLAELAPDAAAPVEPMPEVELGTEAGAEPVVESAPPVLEEFVLETAEVVEMPAEIESTLVVEEPVVEEPVAEGPVVEEPVFEEVVAEAPPVLEEAVVEEPLPAEAPVPHLSLVHSAEPATVEPAAIAEALEPAAEAADDSIKVIGPLQVSITLFNIFLNEADELSRRLGQGLAEWALELARLPAHAEAQAHALAGNAATVGFDDLSTLARALEHALGRAQRASRFSEDDAKLFVRASDDIRGLLHQFAAGFLKSHDAELLERLQAYEPEIDPITQSPELVPETSGAHEVHTAEELMPVPSADADEVEPGLPDHIDAELFPIFEEEALELLEQLHAALRGWVQRPNDATRGGACMRVLHTFKGGARLAGAMRLGELAHDLETDVEHAMAMEEPPLLALQDLQDAGDALEASFQQLRARQHAEPIAVDLLVDEPTVASAAAPVEAPTPAEPLAADVADVADVAEKGGDEAAAEAPAEAAAEPAVAPIAPSVQIDWSRFVEAPKDLDAPTDTVVGGLQSLVRVRGSLLERMAAQAGEVSIRRARLESELAQMKGALLDLDDNLERLRTQLRELELQAEAQMGKQQEAAMSASKDFDPLEFDRYTRFQEVTRMLAESVNDVGTVQRSLQRNVQLGEDELAAQSRLTRELQDDLLRTRMIEFDSLGERMHRVVRQAARDAGRQAKLEIVGGSTEVDRSVLERMAGAFEHLLRNSVSHGIEPPETRQAAGKDPVGTVRVELHQHGNEILLNFSDDGAGLNLDRIRQRGQQLGLVKADEPTTDAALMQLIFAPGFSTASQITELSGRGVGMDVVRAEVSTLGGSIETTSTFGKGATFTLRLPLTTALTRIVLLRCGEQVVAVPASLMDAVARVPLAQIESAYTAGQIELGGNSMPFYWLGGLLGQSERGHGHAKYLPVVMVRSAQQRLVIHVDEVIGNQEVVVKNLGPQLNKVPGLAGISLLASGDVALIYNPVALATWYGVAAHQRVSHVPLPDGEKLAPLPVEAEQPPLIMVVDDSLTVRRVTQRLLEREGFRVQLAKDGLDAMEQLSADELPDVVLSDIEMPRMDGFDLVRNMRADSRLADMPVIMITSRIAQKHRDYAEQLGVDHYLGKPYDEDQLLELINKYTSSQIGAETAKQ